MVRSLVSTSRFGVAASDAICPGCTDETWGNTSKIVISIAAPMYSSFGSVILVERFTLLTAYHILG